MSRIVLRRLRGDLLAVAVVALALALACSPGPAGPDLAGGALELAKGKPVSCDAGTALRVTFRDEAADALRSDGAPYEEGSAGGVHTAGNGNLMLWTLDSGRVVNVTTTAFDGSTTDRIFTNSHDNPGGQSGCGLDGMANGSVGSANFVVELGDGNDIVRYGTLCDGTVANRVVTTRSSDGGTWTITGESGVQCRTTGKGRKAVTEQVGTAGAFRMTLEAI